MRCLAAASSALRSALAGPPQLAECLGVARGALYLRICEPPGALVVLCHDGVRLPCGLVLPATSGELPLTSLAAPTASFVVGDRAVRWTGPAGPVDVRAVREWAPARPARGTVSLSALATVRAAIDPGESYRGKQQLRQMHGGGFAPARARANPPPRPEDRAGPGVDARLLANLAESAGDDHASAAVAADLLGRGPGLTPAGDDVLAGFLVGAAAFGVEGGALRQAIAVLAAARTTALSAALLWHAARGECIAELAGLAAVLTNDRGPEHAERAVSRLVSVGRSSGAAMALGLVIAAESAVHRQAGRAA
jgi:hypothetical protein